MESKDSVQLERCGLVRSDRGDTSWKVKRRLRGKKEGDGEREKERESEDMPRVSRVGGGDGRYT